MLLLVIGVFVYGDCSGGAGVVVAIIGVVVVVLVLTDVVRAAVMIVIGVQY